MNCASAQRILRRDLELDLRILDHLQQESAVDAALVDAQVGVGGGLGIAGDQGCRLGQRVDQRAVGLRILLQVFFGCVQHRRRTRPALHLVRIEHDVRLRIARQFLVLERRRGEVGVDLGLAGDHGRGGVRMRDRLGQAVEPLEFADAPLLGRRHLQDARLHRHRRRRQRDAVGLGEVGDRLHLRIGADQVVREIAERGDRP